MVPLMKNECSLLHLPVVQPTLRLSLIWKVEADQTYDVLCTIPRNPGMIALRCLGGKGTIDFFKEAPDIMVKKGDLLFVESENIRHYQCLEKPWNFWWFEFLTSDKKVLPLYAPLTITPSTTEPMELEHCFTLLRKNRNSAVRYATTQFSMMVHRWLYRWETENEGGNKFQRRSEVIERMIERIHESPEKVSTTQLAYDACLSDRHFRNMFKTVTGQTPKRYIDNVRISLACEMLRAQFTSLSNIAERLGYCDAFHFSKAFRKSIGVSPSRYK